MKFFPNLLKALFLVGVFYAPPTFAKSGLPVTSIDDFQKWVEAKVLCQKTPYKIKVDDEDFIRKMKVFGFKSEVNIEEETGLVNGTVMIQKPVRIHGFLLKEINSAMMTSGSGFYALVAASPDNLAKLVKNKKLNKHPSTRYEDYANYVFLTSKPDADGLAPEGIVIIKTVDKNITQIGCEQFDY